jgi:hypothetical protein
MKKKAKLALLIACVCITAAGTVVWFIWNKPHRSVENEKGLKVTAEQLVIDYELSDSIANSKYLDRAIAVTGKVAVTAVNQDGQNTVTLQSASLLSSVYCTLKKGQPVPAAGNTVLIKGICTGKLSDVVIIDAIIEK